MASRGAQPYTPESPPVHAAETVYYSHSFEESQARSGGKLCATNCTRIEAGANARTAIASRELMRSGELACYDGVAANLWALNSALECHLHTVAIHPPAIGSKEVRWR